MQTRARKPEQGKGEPATRNTASLNLEAGTGHRNRKFPGCLPQGTFVLASQRSMLSKIAKSEPEQLPQAHTILTWPFFSALSGGECGRWVDRTSGGKYAQRSRATYRIQVGRRFSQVDAKSEVFRGVSADSSKVQYPSVHVQTRSLLAPIIHFEAHYPQELLDAFSFEDRGKSFLGAFLARWNCPAVQRARFETPKLRPDCARPGVLSLWHSYLCGDKSHFTSPYDAHAPTQIRPCGEVVSILTTQYSQRCMRKTASGR